MNEIQQILPIEKKTSQEWHKYNLAKTNEKRLFYELLSDLGKIIVEPKYSSGRPPLNLKDMFFSLGLKLYSNYSGRKVISDLKLAQGAGYISRVPHFNTIKDFLNCEGTYDLLSKMLTISAMPLKELEDQYSIDSSGFGSYEYERWQRIKWDNAKDKRNYLKGHVMVGTKTNVIVESEVTPGNFSDIKQAPRLLLRAKGNFNIKEVSCDKAYSSKLVFRIIETLGAIPFIPFKSNVKNINPDSPEIWNKMFLYFTNKRDDFNKHYHKRSNVETTFSMIKLKFGEFLKSKNYTAQRNELMMKFICHNICCLIQEIYENQINVDFREVLLQFIEHKIPEEYNTRDGSRVKNEAYMYGLLWINIACMGFIFVVAWFLWVRRAIGGADVKILTCLVPYLGLQADFINIFTRIMLFFVIFAFMGLSYGLLGRLKLKRKKNIPFIPVITLTFFIYWLIL